MNHDLLVCPEVPNSKKRDSDAQWEICEPQLEALSYISKRIRRKKISNALSRKPFNFKSFEKNEVSLLT